MAATAAHAAIIVGRIAHVEGEVYRYMDVDDSWVETFQQSPAGTEDQLATGDNSRAEIAFPNDQMVRFEENTEIAILNLDEDTGEFALHSGLARFYNRGSTGRLFVETFRGTARVEPGSAVDILVESRSVTVSAVYGDAVFHSYENGEERVEVISGSTRLEFRERGVVAVAGTIDRNWDRWNSSREKEWTRNRYVRSEYLPESMQEYAYAMEPHGRWQRIYYRCYYYWAWKPRSVAYGWSPYSTGYWYDWHGSPVWIDNNPWGWVTHHHGHWIRRHGAWLWTPYIHVSHVPGVTAIGFNITFGRKYRPHWHPGRVRWIAYNDYIGWLPLAPWETYYGYRKWGPRTVVMHHGPSFSININLSRHKYINHAVVIPKRHLYNRKHGVVNNYKTVKIKNINKTVVINNYKAVPVTEKVRHKRRRANAATVNNVENRVETRVERQGVKERKAVRRAENRDNRKERIALRQNLETKDRTFAKRIEKRSSRKPERKYIETKENKKRELIKTVKPDQLRRSKRLHRENRAVERKKEITEQYATRTAPFRENKTVNEKRRNPERKELLQFEKEKKRRQKLAIQDKPETRKKASGRQHVQTEKPRKRERVAKRAERAEKKEIRRSDRRRTRKTLEEENHKNLTEENMRFGLERSNSRRDREKNKTGGRRWISSLRK
jgi:hypothetical protein